MKNEHTIPAVWNKTEKLKETLINSIGCNIDESVPSIQTVGVKRKGYAYLDDNQPNTIWKIKDSFASNTTEVVINDTNIFERFDIMKLINSVNNKKSVSVCYAYVGTELNDGSTPIAIHITARNSPISKYAQYLVTASHDNATPNFVAIFSGDETYYGFKGTPIIGSISEQGAKDKKATLFTLGAGSREITVTLLGRADVDMSHISITTTRI